jgi:hypothetical protein
VADTWTDVKTPGDGRIYSVGTTYAADTRPSAAPMFSGHPCPSHPLFQANSTMRSVAVLQIAEEDGSILQSAQASFHGRAISQPNPQSGLSNYARAIAVLPGVDALDTRVVICGETFDSHLPEARTPPNAGHLASSSTGFGPTSSTATPRTPRPP